MFNQKAYKNKTLTEAQKICEKAPAKPVVTRKCAMKLRTEAKSTGFKYNFEVKSENNRLGSESLK